MGGFWAVGGPPTLFALPGWSLRYAVWRQTHSKGRAKRRRAIFRGFAGRDAGRIMPSVQQAGGMPRICGQRL